jgi:Ca2+-transporting ATPase
MKRGESSTKLEGLSGSDAKKLLETYGSNEIKVVKARSPFRILFHQIKSNYVIYLMLAALIIAFFLGKTETAYTVLGVIIIVITVGFVQEYKAERAIEALKNMITDTTTVVRDGKEQEILTKEIVPQDIIILRTGDKIPADSVLIRSHDLKVNESMLTGESLEVYKNASKNINNSNTGEPPKDSESVFAGTFITNGKCVAKVMHTGMNTRFGKIAKMISTAEKDLPLQKKLNVIIKYMVVFGIILSLLAGIIMILHEVNSSTLNYEFLLEVLIVVLALAIASFPEGFPVVFISTLAYGAYKMAGKNAIVNRMSIIETLGETTVICSDKTGTITTGNMTVKKIFVDEKLIDVTGLGYVSTGDFLDNTIKIDLKKSNAGLKLLKASILCNDSRIEKLDSNEYKIFGSSTEVALKIMSAKAGMLDSDIECQRIHEIPFSSERKMMSVVVKENKLTTIYVKGAPEIIFKKSKFIISNNKKIKLTKKIIDNLHSKIKTMTTSGYRVVAVAYKEHENTKSKDNTNYSKIEEDLVIVGIIGMEDPPRPEVLESIKTCERAGIKVKMITGDNKDTAEAISKEIGLFGKMLSGDELDALSDDELNKVVSDIVIYYRVRPEHKLRIVKSLKFNGEIVTMTGDGVNDAPALKEAHIGVAMGKNGTDVSRESSDLILKDDRFGTIVDAISEGRTIFANIQKFSVYQISINIAQVLLIVLSVALNMPLPLIAIQILFMNIISDEVTALTLAFNNQSKDVMNYPPRRKSESQIITKKLLFFLLYAGIFMALSVVGTYYIMLNVMNLPLEIARGTVFAMMNMFAAVNAFSFRSFRKPVIGRSPLVNKYTFFAAIFSISATILIMYTGLSNIFELSPIGLNEWILAISVALLFMTITDIIKYYNNKNEFIARIMKDEEYLKSHQIK